MRLVGDYVRNSIVQSNNRKLNKTMKQLSSGKRINSASDNASNLAISEKMRAQIRGLERASRNCEEGISLIQTADSVMGSVSESILRMKELSVQSSNGTNTDSDRRTIEEEFKHIQNSIDTMVKNAEFNGVNIFEKHEDTYATIKGNNKFISDDYLNVISGISDNLTIGVNGEEINIVVPEGRYTVQELADKIDDILFENYIDKGIDLEYTEEGIFNINYENGKDIDFITGGLSYLIYDTNKGNKDGIVIGTTIFNEGEKLIIERGQNDTLSFYLGSREDPITITLDAGRYSREEMIELINKKLDSKGATTVRAVAYGEKFISLSDENDIVTGLKGNMFKIDYGYNIFSSVFYDNTNYGEIKKTNASIISGMQYGDSYTGKVTIQEGKNDKLSFTLNGTEPHTITLRAGEYTASQMATELNRIFQEQSIKMTASSSSNKLTLKSNLYGDKSEISFDTTDDINKNTYESLLMKYDEVKLSEVIEREVVPASLNGVLDIEPSSEIKISDKNNMIKLKLTGASDIDIKLNNGTYTATSLVDELKRALAEKTDKIDVSYSSKRISLKSLDSSITKIALIEDINSAYEAIFREKYIYTMYGNITNGDTKVVQGSTTVIETPAKAECDKIIGNEVTFTSENNKLNYTINGVNKTINITEKTYSRAELLRELNSKMNSSDGSGMVASYDSSGKLVFESERKGKSATLSNFTGTALEIINGYKVYKENVKEAAVTKSKINGKLGISSDVDINSTNNVLKFKYKKSEEDEEEYTITLNEGKYTASKLQTEINRLLEEQGLGEYVKATVTTSDEYSSSSERNGIDFTSIKTEGSFNKDSVSGSFLDVINKREKRSNPEDSYTGNDILNGKVQGTYKVTQNAFIVGRQDIIGRDIEIISGLNDSLIFDFEMPTAEGGKQNHEIRINIPGGIYGAGSVVDAIQDELNKALVEKGLEENLIKAQVGGVTTGMANDSAMFVLRYNGNNDNSATGKYLIHGVRGTAAYTIFYKKEDDIRPAFVSGSRQLDNTIEIKSGKTDLSVNVDGIKYDISLEEGKYDRESFIEMINKGLENATSEDAGATIPMPIVAAIEDGNLKLTYNKLGIHTIDKIQGSAKEIFYEEESRNENVDLEIRTGPNSNQSLTLDKIALSTSLLKINTATIEKGANASKLNKRLDYALGKLNAARVKYGAVQNRLEHIINSDNISNENLQSSESKIRDTDMARAMASFSKLNILSQVTVSLLTQSKELDSQFVQNILR